MRTILLKKPWRDLGRIKVRALTVIVMVAVGLGAYAGLYMSRDALTHTRDTLYRDLRLADLRVLTTPADPTEIPPLDDLAGVSVRAQRLVSAGAIELRDGRTLNAVIVYADPASPPGVNELKILEGRGLDPARSHDVVIERSLREVHGYRPGDRLTLNPYSMPAEVTVAGTGISPEWLIATVDATVFFPMKGSLGVIYASMDLVRDLFGVPLYNEFAFRYAPGADPVSVEAEILERLAPLGVDRVVRREEEFTFRFLEESLKGFAAFIPTLVFVFLLVIFLVTSLTAHRLVVSQRSEIGVLRALGYRRREIALPYLLLAALLCTLGGLLGAGCALAVSLLFAGQYAAALGLPRVIPVFSPGALLAGWLMASAVVVVAFAIPLFGLVRLAPRAILRPDRSRAFTRVPGPFRWAGRGLAALLAPDVSTRFAARNLFRRFGLTVATVLSVALPVALGCSLFIVLSSIEAFKDDSMAREEWDVMVNLRYGVAPEELRGILAAAGVRDASLGVTGFARLRIGGEILNEQVTGFPAGDFRRRLHLTAGRMFEADDEAGIILNENWVDKEELGLRVGATVTAASAGGELPLTIMGLMSDMTVGQAYLPLATAQRLLGMEGLRNGAMGSAGRPLEAVRRELYRHGAVGEVFTLADIERGMREYLAQVRGVMHAALGMSLLIATLFLLATVALNILEREIEYATLRAMGYGRRRLARIVLTELGIETGVAVLLSIPLAVVLALFINHEQGEIYFHIPTAVRAADLALAAGLALVFVPLAGLPGLRHVFRLNVADVVRRRGAG